MKPHKLKTRFIIFLLLIIFQTYFNQAFSENSERMMVTNTQSSHAPRIIPSTLFDDLWEKIKKQPKISSKELALFGNHLLAQKGFNYEINGCEIVKANPHPRKISNKSNQKLYAYSFLQTDGKKGQFEIVNDENQIEGLCGECFFRIPCLEITKQEFLVISEGKQYRLKRTKLFELEKMSLMDPTMKKVIRTWEIPFQSIPIGISQDQTRLYFDTEIETLLLEVSETGLCFKGRNEIKLPKIEDIENHPTDPKNDYLSFRRFRWGNYSAIVRYSAPCT